MQSVKIGKLLRQLAVLISRNFQLIWNQKLTLGSLILQAPLMVLVIKLVGEPDCFTSNLINIGSRTVPGWQQGILHVIRAGRPA